MASVGVLVAFELQAGSRSVISRIRTAGHLRVAESVARPDIDVPKCESTVRYVVVARLVPELYRGRKWSWASWAKVIPFLLRQVPRSTASCRSQASRKAWSQVSTGLGMQARVPSVRV